MPAAKENCVVVVGVAERIGFTSLTGALVEARIGIGCDCVEADPFTSSGTGVSEDCRTDAGSFIAEASSSSIVTPFGMPSAAELAVAVGAGSSD